MIEAMACGTPVIAYRREFVPEIHRSGVTGFIVRNVKEAVKAVQKVPQVSRQRCREVFETRFNVARMCRDYLEVYERLCTEDSLAVAS